jgi:hypothetical protein
MGDHDSPSTCISSNARHQLHDVLLHYFGCLRRDERKAFYDSCDARQQLRIREEHRRIRDHRTLFESRDDEALRKLRTNISILRQSRQYRELHSQGPAVDTIEQGPEDPGPPNRYGLYANMILFRDSKKYTDKDYPDEFPNQKIPIDELLYNKDRWRNPLMRKCPSDLIRYFHLPANNMSWVEVCPLSLLSSLSFLLSPLFFFISIVAPISFVTHISLATIKDTHLCVNRKLLLDIMMKRSRNMKAPFGGLSVHLRHI